MILFLSSLTLQMCLHAAIKEDLTNFNKSVCHYVVVSVHFEAKHKSEASK